MSECRIDRSGRMLMILQDCAIIIMGLWFLFLLKSRNEGRDGAGREAE